MNDTFIRTVDLPIAVKGYTTRDSEGDFNVYINARYSRAMQYEIAEHEIMHIREGHFSNERYLEEAEKDNITNK